MAMDVYHEVVVNRNSIPISLFKETYMTVERRLVITKNLYGMDSRR